MAVAMMNRPFRRAWNYAMDFNLKCEKLKNFLSIMLRIMGECNKESLRRQMEICSRLILYFISQSQRKFFPQQSNFGIYEKD